MTQKSKALNATLSVMAALLVLGGAALFWVAWRGIQVLKGEASHAASVATGNPAALTGKTDYVGTWTDGFRTLTIRPDATADYGEVRSGSKTELHGSVAFEKDSLVVDALVTKKRLHIDTPPHPAGTRMVMTLDGAELARE